MTNKKPLFKDFDAITAQQWKQKIQFELKGADYNKTLIWESLEGIKVKPFYHADDLVEPKHLDKNSDSWKITEFIYAGNAEIANKKALKALQKGAQSIYFTIPSEDISPSLLLQNIPLETTLVYVEFLFASPEYYLHWKAFENTTNKGLFFQNDILAHLSKTGNWYVNQEKDVELFVALTKQHKKIVIDATVYQNAGANFTQQLAYTLAQLNEYISLIPEVELTELKVVFKITVGTNYFFEIAKIRALRLLWKTLALAYTMPTGCHIIATPTRRNKTLYDYNANMLRTTTESMAAILGGADAICNMPYDAIYHKTNEFAARIARNQLLLLKEESYFDKISNPSDGSYYIESLTQQVAEKALGLFKEIEKAGGFLKQLKANTLQKKIKESAQKEQVLFDNQEEILVGSNRYQDSSDTMKHNLEIYPFAKNKPRKSVLEPIIQKRLSEELEQKRLEEEG